MVLLPQIKPSSGVSSGKVFMVGLTIIKKPGFRCPEASSSSTTTISLRRVNHTDFFKSFSASKALSKELVKDRS